MDFRRSPSCRWHCRDAPHSCDTCLAHNARLEGAAIAAGIIALGEWARRCGRRVPERSYYEGANGRRLYSVYCLRCGDYLKGRHAGVDEGTDAELCGVCAEILDEALRPR